MRADRARARPAASHLDHDFRRPPDRAGDLRNLTLSELDRSPGRTTPASAEDVQHPLAISRNSDRAPSHTRSLSSSEIRRPSRASAPPTTRTPSAFRSGAVANHRSLLSPPSDFE